MAPDVEATGEVGSTGAVVRLGEAYVSGALTALGDGAPGRSLYELVGELAEGEGYSAYVPHRHTDPLAAPDITPRAVYEIDREHVAAAAVVVAYGGSPSFGVGTEVEIAREHGVPVVVVVERDRAVSRILLGNPAVVEVVRYADLDDLRRALPHALRRVRRAPAVDDEAVVRRFLRTLADARRLPDAELEAVLRDAALPPTTARDVRAAVARGRLFGAGLRDLVTRHGLGGRDLEAFLQRYVLNARRRAGTRGVARVLARLGVGGDDEAVAQWLVTELIAPPPRALQLRLFAAATTERT